MKLNPEDIGHTGRLEEDAKVIKGDYFIFRENSCIIKKLNEDQVILYKLKDIKSVHRVIEIDRHNIKFKTIYFVKTSQEKVELI